jgi:hypothetical protein
MVASTALAANRREREEVQLYVEDMLARRAPAEAPMPRDAAVI